MKADFYAKAALKGTLIALLAGCLFAMPYGYYQFVRWACTLLFAYLAYLEWGDKRYVLAIPLALCAVLFNPFEKFVFKRHVWQTIDTGLAVALFVWLSVETTLYMRNRRTKSA